MDVTTPAHRPQMHQRLPALASPALGLLDTHRARLLAQRASLHNTLLRLSSTSLPAATSRAQLAHKRHIKAAAHLDHALLRASAARNALVKLLHTHLPTDLPPALQASDHLATQITLQSEQSVREWLAHVEQATTLDHPGSLSDSSAAEIQRLSDSIAAHAASLVAIRAETVKLHAFRAALLRGSPPPTHPCSSHEPADQDRLLAHCQRLAASHATTADIAIPLTRHLTRVRQEHAARLKRALTGAKTAVAKHAAVLRVLLQVHEALRSQAEGKARDIRWVRERIVQGCVEQVTPRTAADGGPPPAAAHVARAVGQVTHQLHMAPSTATATATAAKDAELVDIGHAVQGAVQRIVSNKATWDTKEDNDLEATVSEHVTELTLSVPRMAKLVDRVLHRPQPAAARREQEQEQEEDWARWVVDEVHRVGERFKAGAGAERSRAGGRMLDEYL